MAVVTPVYFDSTLIAKFYLNEPVRDAVRAVARQMGHVVTSGVAVAEVAAAFHRKLKEDAVEDDVFQVLMGQFGQDLEDDVWRLAGPSEELLRQVHSLISKVSIPSLTYSLEPRRLSKAMGGARTQLACRKIFSMALPCASSSTSLSR